MQKQLFPSQTVQNGLKTPYPNPGMHQIQGLAYMTGYKIPLPLSPRRFLSNSDHRTGWLVKATVAEFVILFKGYL